MRSFFFRYATPLITGLFLVSLVSGVALFFHWQMGWFHSMHEWLSMVLIVPFVLHLWRNWRPLMNYMKKAPMALALAASLVAALAFAIPATSGTGTAKGGRPPQFALAQKLLEAPLSEVAPVLDTTPEDILARLTSAGYQGTADQSATQIAEASGTSADTVARLLMP
ncbi:DUF4405 domain-containing protein [Thioclava sp. GXIMD4216]|uniref:DUF4405 domain-containing protein n=1 Tax=Thioclava litoralis TaxID=3076557 RepID=A0ABZ1DZ24_9RHOB|nr:DUF4405 domain-containing protein [Thioclava sp. FTW29]